MRALQLAAVILTAMCIFAPGAAAAPQRAFLDGFDTLDAARWAVGDHYLGRSHLDPANVAASGGALSLALPAGTTDGGEIRSLTTYSSGVARARLRTAAAPSSLTGFFLYAPPDYASEIDIEIVGADVMFSTYAGGAQTHTETRPLGFDPTAAFHDYAIAWSKGRVTFSVDGAALRTWTTGVPTAPMNLYANAWFPAWLDGIAPEAPAATLIDQIEYALR